MYQETSSTGRNLSIRETWSHRQKKRYVFTYNIALEKREKPSGVSVGSQDQVYKWRPQLCNYESFVINNLPLELHKNTMVQIKGLIVSSLKQNLQMNSDSTFAIERINGNFI